MSIEKCKDFEKDGYGTWDDSSKPTTYAYMHDYMKNQNNVTLALASGLWQPSTAYSVGQVVHSPSLPAGCKATCTTAGTTGSTEPKWTAYGTTVTDGTVKWTVETDVQGTMDCERKKAIDDMHTTITGEVKKAITNAIDTLHDTIKTELQAEVKTVLLTCFPVGTILETTNSDNPSTYIGGTWEQLDAGLTTITAGTYTETHNVNGTDVTDTYVFTAGSREFTVNGTKAQGEAKHQITEGELAKVQGSVRLIGWSQHQEPSGCISINANPTKFPSAADESCVDTTIRISFGGNQPHNTLQPVYGVYKFRRIN